MQAWRRNSAASMRSISSRIPKTTEQNKISWTQLSITKCTYFVFQIRQYWEPDRSLAFGFHCTSTSGLWPNQTTIKTPPLANQRRLRESVRLWPPTHLASWGQDRLGFLSTPKQSTSSPLHTIGYYKGPCLFFSTCKFWCWSFLGWVTSWQTPLELTLELLPKCH